MEENTQHFSHIILHYFKEGKNTAGVQKVCAVFGEGAVTHWTCQKWLAKFCARDFSLDNDTQSGRSAEVDSDQIETLIGNN